MNQLTQDSSKGSDFARTEGIFLGIFIVYVIGIFLLVKYVIPLPELIERVSALGAWAPLLFVSLYILRGFVYFPGGAFLIASGVLFSPLNGSIYYLVAIILSASLSHLLGRKMRSNGWFPRLRQRLEAPGRNEKIRNHGYRAVFLIHLFGLSFDIPNYLSGYLNMGYFRFLSAAMSANTLVVVCFRLILHLSLT